MSKKLETKMIVNGEGSAIKFYYAQDVDTILAEKDKVITKLKEKLVEQTTLRVWAEIQLRHNKYKRCLAMHDYCLCELEFAFRDPCIERSIEGCVRWRKWANLWLELAEKFKEVR